MLKLIRAHTVTQAGLLADVSTPYYELSGNMHIILFFCFRFFFFCINPQPRPRPPYHGKKGRRLLITTKKRAHVTNCQQDTLCKKGA